MLVDKYRKQYGDGEDKEIRGQISRALASSPNLRNKRDLVEDFVDRVSPSGNVDDEWQGFVRERMRAELDTIISEEKLNKAKAYDLMPKAFLDREVLYNGTRLPAILPKVSKFGSRGKEGSERKRRVAKRLEECVERFAALGAGMDWAAGASEER